MTVQRIIYLPDEKLRRIAEPVKQFDSALQTLIDDMFDTMYHARGVGLAAPQIGISLRLSVIDISGDKKEPLVIINPEIISSEGKTEYEEGCLSIPGAHDKVVRATKVTIRALDRFAKPFEIKGEGLLGECIQHEIDHLNGKLFIDLLSPLRRARAKRMLEKYKRQYLRKV